MMCIIFLAASHANRSVQYYPNNGRLLALISLLLLVLSYRVLF